MGTIRNTLRVLWQTRKAIKQAKIDASELASLPMSEFLPRWQVTRMTGENETPQFRPPPGEDAIRETESRLAISLPEEIRQFYSITDGIDWSAVEYCSDVPRVSELAVGTAGNRPLSEFVIDYRKECEPELVGEKSVRVFAPSLRDLMADNARYTISFDALDSLLVINQNPYDIIVGCVCVATKDFSEGSILQIENGVATAYASFRDWMANDMADFTSDLKG